MHATMISEPPRRKVPSVYRGRLGFAWLCALITAVFIATPAAAIDPSRRLPQCLHRIWQMQQDLPNATITCILQTSDEYLWLGTPDGLVRFDGMRFASIPFADAYDLPRVHVTSLVEDREGNLWIGTDADGLFRWRGGRAERLTKSNGLVSDTVYALLIDRNDALWIGTSQGITRRAGTQTISFGTLQGLPCQAVRALAETADGIIWAGGDAPTVGVWNGVEFAARTFAGMPDGARITSLCATPTKGMWIGATHGLLNVRDDGQGWWTREKGLPDDRVHCLSYGSRDSLWVGTQKGFSRIHADEIDSFLPQDGLSQSTVYAVSEDHEGSLWVGTKHGLNQFADRRTLPFTTREGLPSNDVGPVLQDNEDTIWVGTRGGGLARYDGREFTVLTTADGLLSDHVISLALDDQGALWVGADQGVSHLRHGRIVASYTAEQGLPDNFIRCLLWSESDGLLAGTRHGLTVLRDGAFHKIDAEPLRSASITAISQANGEVLVATEGNRGPYIYRDNLASEFAPGCINTSPIDAMLPLDGELWLGTQSSGMVQVRDGAVHHFGLSDGLHDNEIFGIVADDRDRLWMACSKGIFSVERATFANFITGKRRRLECMPFSPMDGQRTIECQADAQPAVWRMRDGRIWFSTIHGIVVVDPQQTNRPLPKAPVLIEEVTVNGATQSPGALAEIPRGVQEISFRYSAISYRSPARITFQYRLDGFDNDWIEAGTRREAFYTNLRPGDYQFRVAARNVDGQLSELATPLEFTIRPLIYQTAWFVPMCIAALALSAWLGYQWRVRWIKSRMQAVVSERTRIARELHDTLMQGFAGVTMQMQALLGKLPASEARGRLEEIIGDAGVCLREARRSIAGLRGDANGHPSLGQAIADSARQLTAGRDIAMKLELATGSTGLSAQREYQVLRIAQEALTNVVKHAQATTIAVTLERLTNGLILTISDDGVGFNADDFSERDRFGLVGMRERAEQLGAQWTMTSAPSAGTTITLDLPLASTAGERPLPEHVHSQVD